MVTASEISTGTWGLAGTAGRTQDLIQGESKGMTRNGSSSAFWLYASKPVGAQALQGVRRKSAVIGTEKQASKAGPGEKFGI
jgi:hypothetical protein